MQEFLFYLTEGWNHIMSKDALDHQLFLLALMALYCFKDIKTILWLVTAFTLGHSITLALSVLQWFSLNSKLVEILIPVSILITCVFNLLTKKNRKLWVHYTLAAFFGLVHGLGFASTLQFMLARSQSLGKSLVGFNVGLELGQIVIVALILFINFLWLKIFKFSAQIWSYLTSGLAFCAAFYILYGRL